MTRRRTAPTRIEFTFPVACGSCTHDVVCEATAWGHIAVHSPCDLLPPAARCLSQSSCEALLPAIQRCLEARLQAVWCSHTPSWTTEALPAAAQRKLDEFVDRVREQKETLAKQCRKPAPRSPFDDDARCWASFVLAARDPEPAAALLATGRHWAPALLLAALCARDWRDHPLGIVLAEQVIQDGRIISEFRARSAVMLGQIGHAPHAVLLVDAVCGTEHDVQLAALEGLQRLHERLGQRGQPGAHPVSQVLAITLTRAYERYTQGEQRLVAWLADWARPRLELLIDAVGVGEPASRVFAAKLLGQLRDVRAAEALRRATGDAHPEVVQAATDALIALGPALVREGESSVPLLVAALGHRPDRLTLFALRTVGAIGSPRAVDRVLEVLCEARTDELRVPAIDTLGRIGDVRTVEPLLQHFGDRADVAPWAAAKALAAVISRLATAPSSVAVLRRTLASGDPLVVGASLRKLADIDSPSAACAVADALAGLDEQHQVQALMALRELDKSEVLGTVLKFLADPKHRRAAEVIVHAVPTACSLLRQFAGATGPRLDLVLSALKCPYVQVARTAARVLWSCSDDCIVIPLLHACVRGDGPLSHAAGTCLKRRITAEQVVWLTKILSDGDDRMARGAEAALVTIGNRAVGVLIKAMNWQYLRARLAAIRTLGRIGNKRAVAVLQSASKDPDHRVRALAASALDAIRVPRM